MHTDHYQFPFKNGRATRAVRDIVLSEMLDFGGVLQLVGDDLLDPG